MRYFLIENQKLISASQPPTGMAPLTEHTDWLLPPVITIMHRNFQAWGTTGYSPGPLMPNRVWVNAEGALVFSFGRNLAPKRLMQLGLAPDLAAWLVMLDKWMETFVVVARARAIWPVQDLAGALTFMTPAFLPRALVAYPPDNWTRVAQALALALMDNPLTGAPTDRHWQQTPV